MQLTAVINKFYYLYNNHIFFYIYNNIINSVQVLALTFIF